MIVVSVVFFVAIRVSGQAAMPPESQPAKDDSFFTTIFTSGAPEDFTVTIQKVVIRLALAAMLVALLAFRPRKKTVATPPLHVAQTQILLAVVASALMMIVADNAARAFGIFAAASLVRFRTNIKDPKETTVLLVSLGIGLAAGVGRWELAVVLATFMLATLWILESLESSHLRGNQLTIKTHNLQSTEEALRRIFEQYRFKTEVKELNREDSKNPFGKIVYSVNLAGTSNFDRLSDEIFAADPNNIDSIRWHHGKVQT